MPGHDSFPAPEDADRLEQARDAVEMTDLQPTERSHYLLLRLESLRARLFAASPGVRGRATDWRRRAALVGRGLLALSLVLFLLALLLSSVPAWRSRLIGLIGAPALSPTPEPATSGIYTIVISGSDHLEISTGGVTPGPLPATCPQGTDLQSFLTPLDPPGLGAGPFWISGFTGPSATLLNLNPVPLTRTPGWYESLTLFMQKGFSQRVTLSGHIQGGREPVQFARSAPNDPHTSITFDPQTSMLYTRYGTWEMATVLIFVASSGCFTLQASWPGGGWTRYFAAGS